MSDLSPEAIINGLRAMGVHIAPQDMPALRQADPAALSAMLRQVRDNTQHSAADINLPGDVQVTPGRPQILSREPVEPPAPPAQPEPDGDELREAKLLDYAPGDTRSKAVQDEVAREEAEAAVRRKALAASQQGPLNAIIAALRGR